VVAAPKTRYAKSGDIDIAYQVLGDGPVDLLMFAGAAVPIDCVDDERGRELAVAGPNTCHALPADRLAATARCA